MNLFKLFQVSREDIEWYIGEDELPPYCEMTVKAAKNKEQHGDLQYFATLKGTETAPIMIELPYELTTHPQLQSLPVPQQSLTDTTKSTIAKNSKIASDEGLALF